MQRKPVESSQIKSVGYEPESRVLEIEFTPSNYGAGSKRGEAMTQGSVYQYENVEKDVADGFFVEKEPDGKKRSVGSYFGKTVKPFKDKYPYKKVSPVN